MSFSAHIFYGPVTLKLLMLLRCLQTTLSDHNKDALMNPSLKNILNWKNMNIKEGSSCHNLSHAMNLEALVSHSVIYAYGHGNVNKVIKLYRN